MKKICFPIFLLLAFLTACNITPDTDEYESFSDRWEFIEITDQEGNQVRTIAPGDYMEVRKDKTFTYELKNAEIMAEGKWYVEDGDAVYEYAPEGGVRRYNIREMTDSTLILEEKGVEYRFRRGRR
jgi:hypothetical protein